MYWIKEYMYVSQYKYTSTNQYGSRYKRIEQKRLSVANISCKKTDIDGMRKLILLSHTLDIPVRYDFDEQEAYIKVVGKECI